MKTLKDKLNESLVGGKNEMFNGNDKTLIEPWIKENYEIYGTLKIYEDKYGFVVDSDDNVEVANKNIKSLTNGMFRWGEIASGFDCSKCTKLISLEGAPKKCDDFYCPNCTGLISLEGVPNECNNFDCSGCVRLRSLEGVPNKCYSFDCSGCTGLKSLKGAPQLVSDWFDCSGCTKLRSLEGAPSRCSEFYCPYCTDLRSLEGAPMSATIKCSECTNLTITDDDRKKYKIKS